MSTRVRLTVLSALSVVLVSLSLTTVFADASWLNPALAAIAVVALTCSLARAWRLPRWAVPLAGLVGLVLLLTTLFVPEPAVLRLWPGPGAWRAAWQLVLEANDDVVRYRAPLSPGTGLTAVTVAGIGLVALAVDTATVTYRRAVYGGVALLGLFAVPATLSPSGVGPWLFLLAASGWLVLLVAESRDRLARWGRPLGYRASDAARERRYVAGTSDPVSAVGRRVGLASLGIALVVPIMLPGLDTPLISGAGPGRGNGGGHRTVAVVNPIIDLRSDLVRGTDTEVIRYRSTDTSPDYLRMVTLDSFTGDSWAPLPLENIPSSQRVDKGIPRVPGRGDTVVAERVQTTVAVRDLAQRWLPLPYGSTFVDIDGTWLYDRDSRNVFSTDTTTQRKTYAVTSERAKPSAAQLARATSSGPGGRRTLELPPLPAVVTETARTVTAKATTPYDKALALQDWLRSPTFTYSTDAPNSNGTNAIEAFLRDRRGFCVHYASAMAVMARSLGIPARVDVGFTPGRRQPDGSWVVTLADAHSWPELWFDGVGWVRFEPTPSVRSQTVPTYAQGRTGTLPGGGTTPQFPTAAGGRATDGLDPRLSRADRQLDGKDPDAQGSPTGGPSGGVGVTTAQRPDRSWAPIVGVGAGLVLLLALPGLLGAGRSRWRWRRAARPGAETAWEQLRDDARDLGFRWGRGETPRQVGARLCAEAPLLPGSEAATALAGLVRGVERERYAPRPAGDGPAKRTAGGDAAALRVLAAAARAGLAARSTRGQRWASRVAPRSVLDAGLDATHRLGARIADALDWADSLGQRRPGRRPAHDGASAVR